MLHAYSVPYGTYYVKEKMRNEASDGPGICGVEWPFLDVLGGDNASPSLSYELSSEVVRSEEDPSSSFRMSASRCKKDRDPDVLIKSGWKGCSWTDPTESGFSIDTETRP